MKRIRSTVFLLFVMLCLACTGRAHAQQAWQKRYGGQAEDAARAVLALPGGGFLIACETRSFGIGASDILLLKINRHGDVLWSKTYGTAEEDYVTSLVEAGDGNFVMAGYSVLSGNGIDARFIKVDTTGKVLWDWYYGTANNEYVNHIALTSDSGFIATGEAVPQGGCRIQYGMSSADRSGASRVQHSASSPLLIKISAKGTLEWSKVYGSTNRHGYGASVTELPGGYVVAGVTESVSIGESDCLLLRTDRNGTLKWSRAYGGSLTEFARSMQVTPEGNLLIGGFSNSFTFNAYNDIYLLKTDTSGKLIWSRTYGGSRSELCYSVTARSDGTYSITGYTGSFNRGLDMLLMETDSSGALLSSAAFGDIASDNCFAYAHSDSGSLLAGETLSGGLGITDIYLVHRDSSGGSCSSLPAGFASVPVPTLTELLSDSSCTFSLDTASGMYSGSCTLLLNTECDNKVTSVQVRHSDTFTSLYPNPLHGRLYLDPRFGEPAVLTVYSSAGNNVHSAALLPGESADLSFLPPGLYLAELRGGRQQKSIRLVVH
jgi:hypothetical protein